jgi:hypothetical protein
LFALPWNQSHDSTRVRKEPETVMSPSFRGWDVAGWASAIEIDCPIRKRNVSVVFIDGQHRFGSAELSLALMLSPGGTN